MTAAKQAILDDAKAAGFVVEGDGTGGFYVTKQVKVNGSNKTRTEGLWLCQNGSAIRVDIDLSVATAIRSHAEMRKVLGI